MNKVMKKLLCACLALAMLITIIPPVTTTQAATKTEKMTLYVGENYTWYTIGFTSLTSASSSQKSVATVKLDKAKKRYTIKAKKAGKTTIVVKGKGYSNNTQSIKINLTVKKSSFSISAQKIDGSYALVKIKNNTSQTFDKIAFKYTFKTPEGSVFAQKEDIAYKVIAGKTTYVNVYVGSDANIDYSNSSFKVTGYDRDPGYTYKTIKSSDLVIKETEKATDDNKIRFKLKQKNKLNQYVSGHIYIISYDANDKIIDVSESGIYLEKKETKTSSTEFYVYTSESYAHPDFDHYKIVYQGFYTKKK